MARLDTLPPWAADHAAVARAPGPGAGLSLASLPEGLEAPSLSAFVGGDPCAAVAHELALSEIWSPEQWNAAVSLVVELRRLGLLPPLRQVVSSPPTAAGVAAG